GQPHPPGDRGGRLGGRRSAQRRFDEHQAAHRNRVLSRIPPSAQPAGSRAAHAHQRSYPQRSAQRHGRAEEEDGKSVNQLSALSYQFSVTAENGFTEN